MGSSPDPKKTVLPFPYVVAAMNGVFEGQQSLEARGSACRQTQGIGKTEHYITDSVKGHQAATGNLKTFSPCQAGHDIY